MTSLSPVALLSVEEAVRAVVDHDDERLALLAPDAGDLYAWTRDYGRHGAVDLVVPPGMAEDWVKRFDGPARREQACCRRDVDASGGAI